jgi:hypothetical protein
VLKEYLERRQTETVVEASINRLITILFIKNEELGKKGRYAPPIMLLWQLGFIER